MVKLIGHSIRQIMDTVDVDFSECPVDCLPVIVIDNGVFTVAGICYNESEHKRFTDPNDSRSKYMFYVPKIDLEQFMV